MKRDRIQLSVIIPVYNEENRLPKTIQEFSVWVEKNSNLNIEIIIVNDGSSDGTEKLVLSYCKKYSWLTLINENHVGMMNAIFEGIKIAKYELICTTEADSPVHPKYFMSFLTYIDGYDMIIGSRFLGKKVMGKSLARRIISKMNSLLFTSLFVCPIKDPQISFRLYKKKCIKKILPMLSLKHDGFKSSEIAVKAHSLGFKLKEIPVDYTHNIDSKAVPGGLKAIEITLGATLALIKLWFISFREFRNGILPICPIKGISIIYLFIYNKNKVKADDYC